MESDRVHTGPAAGAPADGFIALLCRAHRCAGGEVAAHLRSQLGACVMASAHSVLITAPDCLRGPAGCRFRHPGTTVVVQPVDTGQRPVAPAIEVGPIHTIADFWAVRAWFNDGRLDPALLPPHLRYADRRAPAAKN